MTRWRWCASQELRCAAAVLGIADVILMDHPDGELRLGRRPGFPGGNCRCRAPLQTVQRHHLRCRRPLLASRSRRRLRADHHRAQRARRGRAAALPRHLAARYHTAALRGGAGARMGATAEGILESGPDAFGLHAHPPTVIVDVAAVGGAEGRGDSVPQDTDGRRTSVRPARAGGSRALAWRRAFPPRLRRSVRPAVLELIGCVTEAV